MTLHPFNNPKNIIYSHVIKIPTFGLRQKVENGCCMRSGKRKTHNLVRNYLAQAPKPGSRRYKPCIACIQNINFVNECSLMHISLLASSSLS